MRIRSRLTRAARPLLLALLAGIAACADQPTAPAAVPGPLAVPRAAPRADVAALPAAGLALAGPAFSDVVTLGGWIESFNVNPSDQTTWVKAPAPWLPTSPATLPYAALGGWAISKHTRDAAAWDNFEDMMAWHDGGTCNAPPLAHLVADYDESTFFCRNHMMTAMNATGYGVVYLTPNRMVDWAAGEAVVRFDVASLRESGRDWIDLWVMPFDDNLQLPLDDSLPDLNGGPRNGLHLRMRAEKGRSSWTGSVYHDYDEYPLPVASTVGAETPAALLYPSTPQSATRRDTFELRLSAGRLKFGMPRYDLWWIDTPVSTLPFTRGVVQFGHHSFNPKADCASCLPTTWHWDNVGMAPAVAFSIINADRRTVAVSTTPLTFGRPAPDQSYLRFAGYPGASGSKIEISVDGGARWTEARRQGATQPNAARVQSYWTPIARGTTQVRFRATKPGAQPWIVRDATIWSRTP